MEVLYNQFLMTRFFPLPRIAGCLSLVIYKKKGLDTAPLKQSVRKHHRKLVKTQIWVPSEHLQTPEPKELGNDALMLKLLESEPFSKPLQLSSVPRLR